MRLIDADELRKTMYHEAFETDTDMQKWDSGCWIRYKMFENALENAPTIDAEPVRHGKWMHTGFMEVKCNNCLNVFHELEDTNYCPHCGYKMDLDEVSDES